MTTDNKSYRGIPLKERSEADIRDALAGAALEPEVVDRFVRLHAYARDHGLGLSTLAHQTRIPSGVLSPCLNGSYDKGDYVAVSERIEAFFWRQEQKALYGGLREFCRTRLASALWQVLEKTRIIRRIQIVQGPEQVGKSRAAVEYTQLNNSGRTVYVQLAGGSRAGCGDFIWALAEQLGIPYTVKLREKRLRIRSALETCDLLIVDEAHLVFSWTDQAAREFWDYLRTDIYSDGARGVVLVATNQDMLSGIQTWRKRARYNIGQLLGRMRVDVLEIDPAEDITEADVALLVQRYYAPGKIAVRKLHDLACREQLGHFGLLQDILNESWTRAKARKIPLSDEIVLSTAREVLDTLKTRKDLYE